NSTEFLVFRERGTPLVGYRTLGDGVSVTPVEDGDVENVQIHLPGETHLTLADRRTGWVRATCHGDCVVAFRFERSELSIDEQYPESFHMLRILRAGQDVSRTPSD